jgi:predicted glycosyltransferase
MFYSHDTYGLGHLRRTLLLARHLRAYGPLSQLVLTGSPLAHRFAFPDGADYIKLPAVVKRDAGRYESRILPLRFRHIRALRSEIALSAARHLRPDVLVVDNVPAGLKGELRETIAYLASSGCRLVLGLRDVVDEPTWVREQWERDGSYDLLTAAYDRILVYGRRDVCDVVSAYGFPEEAAAKTRFVGYLRPEIRFDWDENGHRETQSGERVVLVMAGGGGDGFPLLRSVLDAAALAEDGRLRVLLVGGPLMPEEDRRRIHELAAGRRSVTYVEFVEDLGRYLASADAVVSMGGYNSVCELLSSARPALIVPRVKPRREQLIRAEALASRGLVRMLHPDDLTPERLLDEIEDLLDLAPPPPTITMDGLANAAAELDDLLRAGTVRERRVA